MSESDSARVRFNDGHKIPELGWHMLFLTVLHICSVQVRVAGGAELEADLGPASLQPGAPNVALVIRKPELRIDSDWVLEFSYQ